MDTLKLNKNYMFFFFKEIKNKDLKQYLHIILCIGRVVHT